MVLMVPNVILIDVRLVNMATELKTVHRFSHLALGNWNDQVNSS